MLNSFKYNSLLTPNSRGSRGSPKGQLPAGIIEERARSPSRMGPALNSEDQYQVLENIFCFQIELITETSH